MYRDSYRDAPSRTPLGRGLPLLYLDYDGVLHRGGAERVKNVGWCPDTPGAAFFEFAGLVADLVAPHPRLKIVLSTSWHLHHRGFAWAKSHLPPALQERIIGGTFHRSMFSRKEFQRLPRGVQVSQDVLRRRPSGWLAVDDESQHWPAWCADNLIETDKKVGLADPAIVAAIAGYLASICKPEEAKLG